MYDSEFLDDLTKTKIVLMILDKQTEQALQLLSNFYNTDPPNLAVGKKNLCNRLQYLLQSVYNIT
jgi:hypothetical protein